MPRGWNDGSEQMALFNDEFIAGARRGSKVPESLASGGIPIAASTGEFGGGGDDFDSVAVFDDPDDSSPAPLTLVPTSSTDPKRPRTIAAGYSKTRQVMTVVFRDGTWWNYYGVSQALWNNFKKAYSKGWYLRNTGLDTWPNMGPATTGFMAESERAILQAHAAAVQTRLGGLQVNHVGTTSQAQAARRGMDRALATDKKIKAQRIMAADGKVSNPYIERKKREAARRINGSSTTRGNKRGTR